jgi:hypothetical protein
VGYTEIFKNDQGVFIEVTKAELFPETAVTGVTIGAAAGGLVGGIIGAVIDANHQTKRIFLQEFRFILILSEIILYRKTLVKLNRY